MAKKQTTSESVKVRVLTDCHINGEFYKTDSTPELPADIVCAFEQLGVIDSNEQAVAYAQSING